MYSIARSAIAVVVMTPLLFSVVGCQSDRANELAYVEKPVEALYNAAAEDLDRKQWDNAILRFNEVERQHPYSDWARRSMIMSTYASYKKRDYSTAIESARRFLALHPGSDSAPYAYYLIGLSYFDQIVDVGRDQERTEDAKAAINDLIRRFPDSEYAIDANDKLNEVNNQLAGKEMEVGRWYLRRDEHLPAINRFKNVVDKYETSVHTSEALFRLVEAYLSIGLRGEAEAAAAVLGHNFPNSDWHKDSFSLMQNASKAG